MTLRFERPHRCFTRFPSCRQATECTKFTERRPQQIMPLPFSTWRRTRFRSPKHCGF